MPTALAIGECLLELTAQDEGLWKMAVAGDTLNTAWYLRGLLPSDWRVEYFTRLGTDRFSDRIASFLEESRIDGRWIARDPNRGPGLYAVSVTGGERSFSYWREKSAARRLADDVDLLARAVSKVDLVYISGITLAILAPDRREALLEVVGAARDRGALVALDPNIRVALWESEAAMRASLTSAIGLASISLPSFDDERVYFADPDVKACAERHLRFGTSEVVVKNGGDRMAFGLSGGAISHRVLPRVTPVDTTAAGDSFNAAYLTARLLGASQNEAVERGHRLAARVVRHVGALAPLHPGETCNE